MAAYQLDEMIFPSTRDTDLWQKVFQTLLNEYGVERVLEVHARWAFETVCDECDDALVLKDFIRKVRLKWLWKRPPLPRGMAEF